LLTKKRFFIDGMIFLPVFINQSMAKTTTKKNLSKNSLKSNGKQVNKVSRKNSTAQFSTHADESLEQLFIAGLREAYWMENHLVKVIPKMAAAAANSELRHALEKHVEVTRDHASRLEEVFTLLNERVIAKKCDACEGLTMSGEHVIENTITGTPARDIGIIMSALKVENFEITTYEGLIQVATSLGKANVTAQLRENLDEEEKASDLLTELSQTSIEEPA